MARRFKPGDAALTERIREGLFTGQSEIFLGDLEMLESQQRNLLAHPERRLMKLNIDSGGVQSRRILERLIKDENNRIQVAAG